MEFVRNPITGDVSVKTDAQAVIRSIRNILLTSSGEKKFNPNFGGSIRSLLFDQVDPITTPTRFAGQSICMKAEQ